MTKTKKSDELKIEIDGKEFQVSDLSEQARAQIASIQFCDTRVQQLQNEWAVADTARLGYAAALKREAN